MNMTKKMAIASLKARVQTRLDYVRNCRSVESDDLLYSAYDGEIQGLEFVLSILSDYE